ncbi:DUF5068 domain-containing protein [Listeria monocytogenes]|uniref:DUF5068 domain-containing protein n=1 Tax=Listeria monocytogenes TaxID=1639 RepID=UPI0010D477E9|nr:DUF5068 domain-containing protein [Listeria monocytogenes]EAD0723688.1 DUF5068 domain-containing protein [Listeria monocytogenes]EAK8417239.1 DUF5068 domain-containing protein [Listeria monocytogenes]EBF5151058.1 DUF5068 domain-containing protein [Listeria monocytogenes]EBF5203736.1 DUF5068 domain-containing protein [Listeria monocytogenes]EHD1586898.1 DUF5068 domain-containing protein [Listeria monocytogenes]
MKKLNLIFLILGISLLTACGGGNEDKADKKEQKETSKNTEIEKSNSKKTNSKEKTDKSTEKAQEKTEDTSEKNEQPNKEETPQKAEKNTEKKAVPATSSISQTTFNQSTTLPITGGNVTTVYNSTSPKMFFFGPLNVTISKYKVESVVGSDKQIDAYSPESYLGRRDGYVVTLDVIIQNTTNSTVSYKADHISLNGKGISKGGSLENFIPVDKQLNHTSAVFPKMAKQEGYITYMLNNEDYEKLKEDTTITANNPNDFNSPAIKGTTKGNITLNFPISK